LQEAIEENADRIFGKIGTPPVEPKRPPRKRQGDVIYPRIKNGLVLDLRALHCRIVHHRDVSAENLPDLPADLVTRPWVGA